MSQGSHDTNPPLLIFWQIVQRWPTLERQHIKTKITQQASEVRSLLALAWTEFSHLHVGPSATLNFHFLHYFGTNYKVGVWTLLFSYTLKLRNINLLNVTLCLIPQNPRERMLSIYISLFITVFPLHISQLLTSK